MAAVEWCLCFSRFYSLGLAEKRYLQAAESLNLSDFLPELFKVYGIHMQRSRGIEMPLSGHNVYEWINGRVIFGNRR
jgi:hypothetical protein